MRYSSGGRFAAQVKIYSEAFREDRAWLGRDDCRVRDKTHTHSLMGTRDSPEQVRRALNCSSVCRPPCALQRLFPPGEAAVLCRGQRGQPMTEELSARLAQQIPSPPLPPRKALRHCSRPGRENSGSDFSAAQQQQPPSPQSKTDEKL